MMALNCRFLTITALLLINGLHHVVLGRRFDSHGFTERLVGDFISVQRLNGQRTIAARLGGVSAIETATSELPHQGRAGRSWATTPSFIFREVTDGREVIQAVFDETYTAKNCYITTDKDILMSLVELVKQSPLASYQTSPYPPASRYQTKKPKHPTLEIVNTPRSLVPYLQYSFNASDRTLAYIHKTAAGTEDYRLPALLRSIVSLNITKSQCRGVLSEHLSSEATSQTVRRRHRRGLLTYPKTLWCGKGTEARNYDELGEEASTDMCCREHDNCKYLQINPMERKMFLLNMAPYTISDCKCDKRFHQCLKRTRTPVSMGVGEVYFNRLKTKCFVIRKKFQCLESTWYGSCLRREKIDTAVIRDARPFPEGKNFTKEEKALRRKRRRELLLLH